MSKCRLLRRYVVGIEENTRLNRVKIEDICESLDKW